jgi:hypothetical protein
VGGSAVGVRDGVDEVPVVGGVVAAGPAAGQIAATHEIGQGLGGYVPRFGCRITGLDQGDMFG